MTKAKSIPARYKLLGKERRIVVESGYSMHNGKRVPNYRIVGRLWGK